MLDRKRGRLDCSRFRFLVIAALVVADVIYHPVVATEAFRPAFDAGGFFAVHLADTDRRAPAVIPSVVVGFVFEDFAGGRIAGFRV